MSLTRSTEERRWDFLVGEGTLTAHEVVEWAAELNPSHVKLPGNVGSDEDLMVAIANDIGR